MPADHFETGRREQYSGSVSQAERVAVEEALENLSAADRAWLEERLSEYRELLAYLHDH